MSTDILDEEWYWREDAALDPRFNRFRANVAVALKEVIAHPTDPDALDRFWANYFVRCSMPWFNEARSEGEQSVASLTEGLKGVLHYCFTDESRDDYRRAMEDKVKSAVAEWLAVRSPSDQGRRNLMQAVEMAVAHNLSLQELALAFTYHGVEEFDQLTAQELEKYILEGLRGYGNRILSDRLIEPL